MSGWWYGTCCIFHIFPKILGFQSSQLTLVFQQPSRCRRGRPSFDAASHPRPTLGSLGTPSHHPYIEFDGIFQPINRPINRVFFIFCTLHGHGTPLWNITNITQKLSTFLSMASWKPPMEHNTKTQQEILAAKKTGWWFGTSILFSQKYWEFHHPN